MKKKTPRYDRLAWFEAIKIGNINYVDQNLPSVDTAHLVTLGQVALGRDDSIFNKILKQVQVRGAQETLSKLLVSAALQGLESHVRMILECGVVDLESGLPLSKAVTSGNIRIVEMLIAAGANPGQCNPGFPNPADLAVWSNAPDIVKLLADHGVQPTGILQAGMTPASLGFRKGLLTRSCEFLSLHLGRFFARSAKRTEGLDE